MPVVRACVSRIALGPDFDMVPASGPYFPFIRKRNGRLPIRSPDQRETATPNYCRLARTPGRHALRTPTTSLMTAGFQLHPVAYAFRKHWKSLAVSVGLPVDPSQLAYEAPEAYLLRKHWKSLAVSTGRVMLPSQLA
jgi:hypothetical protein